MKWRLNKKEIIRCCASCKHIFFIWNKGDMGCPKCDFAHYGARFVYGDWSYLYVLIKVLWYPDNEPFPTFIKFSEISKQLVFKVLGYCEICRHFFVYPKRFHTSTLYDHEESNYKIVCKQCTEDIKECVRSDWEDLQNSV